ncbi:transient receptor potential cation channel subfamily A member 1-like isoform X3 [Ischnura elegans]|uniref:transient receptor potential cation channel subfamily A member 1-like isoform X3 n=1 Tax=Ischnura elegans TaxID=197161 RepID=UPI001ED8B202|nr:transient receptor potential cation channel subfamily A member 1-like isoform X3 [Ischnura elegans]
MGLTSWRWWWPRRLADGGGGVSTSAAAASHVETGSSRFMPVDALRKKYSKEPSLEHEDLMEKLALGSHIKGEVCHIKDSPFYILRVAEKGNVDVFGRLYQADPRRLNVRDPRGRTATHQAAERNKTLILRFIASRAGDLNVQDNAGNTPLHVAVASEALDSIDFLIKNGADTSVLNEKKQAPLHLATELNKVKVLRALIEHKDKFNIQQGGEHGRTPLHIAAILDLDECACILTKEFGACPRQPCHNGYYPIHEAAKNASSKTLEVFLEWGEGRGCSREEMMSFYDAEGNVPLHSAVHGGDIKAVELCLKNGAKISTTQQDLSTPVHLACAQGAKKVIELMFIMQPSEKSLCLASCDIQKMTPVHCAAMFDHVETVEFLAKEGADLNAEDKDGRSALLLAASRAAWRTVHRLISLGADVGLQDSNQRNALHLVVLNGGRLEEFADHLKKCKSEECLRQLLNEKDETGCTPLHYASRGGHIRSLQNLIQLGASVNLKNNNNESALHFAARYGRYNIACQLLDSDKGTFIINETDGKGLTPLHISSQEGHRKVVQLLLNRGALLHRDHNGRNPLHLAAMSGYTKTMELLHSVHSHLIDQVDKDGNSALHLATMENKPSSIKMLLSMGCKLLKNRQGFGAIDYALYYKFPEAALAMVTHEERGEEILSQSSEKYPLVVLALIAYMPHVYGAVLDKGIIKANCKKDSKEFYIKYNFKCLENFQTAASPDQPSGKEVESEKTLPLPVLNGKHQSFSSIPLSLMRTFSMMLGEIDFLGTFVSPYISKRRGDMTKAALPYANTTFFILVIFMVFMPILIMNLLIGLAVGDIESVRRNAQLKRLAMQVVQHTRLERKLPKIFLEKVIKTEVIEYPNAARGKLGFLDSVLKKWLGNHFTNDSAELVPDGREEYFSESLERQKRQLSDISKTLNAQHQLMRLIIQKMEIKTEADEVDEGTPPGDIGHSTKPCSGRWQAPSFRNKLQSAYALSKKKNN